MNEISASGTSNWHQEFQNDLGYLEHLKSSDVFEAIIYISIVLFPLMSNFTEHQMGLEATVENQISQLIQEMNQIQASFNSTQSDDSSNDSSQEGPDETKAINIANQILKEVQTNPTFASIKEDVITQIQNIFGYNFHGEDPENPYPFRAAWYKDSNGDWQMNPKKKIDPGGWGATFPYADLVGMNWASMWHPNDTSSLVPQNPQQVSDALTALSTDFNSQSSVVQSEVKYLQSNDQQYDGMINTIMTDIVKQEELIMNAMGK